MADTVRVFLLVPRAEGAGHEVRADSLTTRDLDAWSSTDREYLLQWVQERASPYDHSPDRAVTLAMPARAYHRADVLLALQDKTRELWAQEATARVLFGQWLSAALSGPLDGWLTGEVNRPVHAQFPGLPDGVKSVWFEEHRKALEARRALANQAYQVWWTAEGRAAWLQAEQAAEESKQARTREHRARLEAYASTLSLELARAVVDGYDVRLAVLCHLAEQLHTAVLGSSDYPSHAVGCTHEVWTPRDVERENLQYEAVSVPTAREFAFRDAVESAVDALKLPEFVKATVAPVVECLVGGTQELPDPTHAFSAVVVKFRVPDEASVGPVLCVVPTSGRERW